MSELIDRQKAIDALCKSECGWNNAECRHKDDTDFCVTCDNVKIIKSLPSAQPEPEAVFEWKKEFKEYIESLDITRDEWKGIIEYINDVPTVQLERKGTRLSTVCLMCKKPAVTFNTEDDIPYTNYSYCEDCLRKGLKLLREQKKNLQAQPERKTGHWILDRSGAYCCNRCMEPCASYVMMKPRDKFCKMCGSRNEVME